MWCRRNNVVALEPIVGGGSAKGQPCDGAHAYFRQSTDWAEDYFLGNVNDPLKRQMLQDLLMDKNGGAKRELTAEQAPGWKTLYTDA